MSAGKAADLPAGKLLITAFFNGAAQASEALPAGMNWAALEAAGDRVTLRQSHGRWPPPWHGPHADPLPLRGGLSTQVGGAIAGGPILPVGESLAAAHHYQVGFLATPELIGNGAAVLVDGLGAQLCG
jgi:hypothetical protein